MPTASGLTTFGIIRRRMSDLYLEFAARIKDGGAFGPVTTVDTPDQYPSDPLVQIASTASASAHELWEATEYWYSQLDPESATGIYLERLHGVRLGIARAPGQSDADYRAIILSALRTRPSRSDVVTIATARPDIDCAALYLSTNALPVEGIPAPGAMLVVKGCNVDWEALAQDLFLNVELGLHSWYGEVTAGYAPASGGCVSYHFQPAQPVFLAVDVRGYFTETCGTNSTQSVATQAVAALRAVYGQCGLSGSVNAASIQAALSSIDGFVVTSVKLAPRRRQLWGNACDPVDAPKVTLCGAEVNWATSITCGPSAGEVWCDPESDCVAMKPWEYAEFDAQFLTVSEDSTLGGCNPYPVFS